MRPPQNIDEYLAALPPATRTALARLLKIIRSAAPQATEVISYRLPAFRQSRMPVGFGATPRHGAPYVMSGTLLAQYRQELSRYDTPKGTIRFQPTAPLPVALVRKTVKARVRENQDRKSN